jgi:ankyrin repeat protein
MKLKAALGFVVLVILVAGFLQMIQAIQQAPALSPLVQAARAGDVETIRDLTAAGTSPNNMRHSRGWTPLMHAVHKDREDSVAALIEAGADVNQRTGKGLTALMLAASYGRTRMVERLITSGADPRLEKDGLTALDFAMLGSDDTNRFTFFECQYDTVAALRRAAPDVEPRAATFDRTLLWLKRCNF